MDLYENASLAFYAMAPTDQNMFCFGRWRSTLRQTESCLRRSLLPVYYLRTGYHTQLMIGSVVQAFAWHKAGGNGGAPSHLKL